MAERESIRTETASVTPHFIVLTGNDVVTGKTVFFTNFTLVTEKDNAVIPVTALQSLRILKEITDLFVPLFLHLSFCRVPPQTPSLFCQSFLCLLLLLLLWGKMGIFTSI